MKNRDRAILYILIILISLMIFFFTPLRQWSTLSALHHRLHDLQHLANQKPVLLSSLYILLYVLTNTLFIPIGVILNLAAGAIWGMPYGFFIALISTTLGATGAFSLTRFMLREQVFKLWGKKIEKILNYVNHRNKLYLFILRLTPMFPYSLVNAAFAFTSLSVAYFALITFLGQILVIAILTNTGTELSKLNTMSDLWNPQMLMALFFFAITPIITTVLIKRFTKVK